MGHRAPADAGAARRDIQEASIPHRNRKPSILTVLQLLAGMALFGSATPLSKIVGQAFPVFSASFARMTIASAVLVPAVLILTDRFARARRSDYYVFAAISAVGMVGFTAAMLFGMRLTTGVIGATIMGASPAVTAAAAVVFMGAAMNWRKGAALALAVAGCVVINLLRSDAATQADAVVLGAALVLLAVCFEAAYTLLSRRLSDGVSSLEATLAASLMAAPLFLVLALVFDRAPFDLSRATDESFVALIFWGAVTGGFAPVLWYNGVRKSSGAMTAVSMSVMPLTALVLSYVLLGETFRAVHLLGFGLVFAGVILMIYEHGRER
jgi:drug/metabolite transporter (DMT)-like permease